MARDAPARIDRRSSDKQTEKYTHLLVKLFVQPLLDFVWEDEGPFFHGVVFDDVVPVVVGHSFEGREGGCVGVRRSRPHCGQKLIGGVGFGDVVVEPSVAFVRFRRGLTKVWLLSSPAVVAVLFCVVEGGPSVTRGLDSGVMAGGEVEVAGISGSFWESPVDEGMEVKVS